LAEPLLRPGVICFGAFANNANQAKHMPLGFVAIWPKGRETYELTRLCVLPEHRHAGLGARLLLAALQAVKGHGARKIEVGIIAENERLKRWYEGHGFRVVAMREYGHLPFTVCEMEREV